MIHRKDLQLGSWGKHAARGAFALMLLVSIPSSSQSRSGLHDFFANNIGLSEDQIAAIKSGKPVVKAMPSRTPAEVLLFGAVYVHAKPEKYIQFAHNFDRLRQLPNYLALGVFSAPPQLSDLSGFSFDQDDIKALKDCKPGDCLIQMPASSMDQAQNAVDWSAPDPSQQVNPLLRKAALDLVRRYQKEGNPALGVFHDKRDPIDVPQQFAYMLSYAKALPEQLPEFHRYLLDYPDHKPSNTEDAFYWAKVKFGLKPTLGSCTLLQCAASRVIRWSMLWRKSSCIPVITSKPRSIFRSACSPMTTAIGLVFISSRKWGPNKPA